MHGECVGLAPRCGPANLAYPVRRNSACPQAVIGRYLCISMSDRRAHHAANVRASTSATSAGALIALVTVAALLTSAAPAVTARVVSNEARHSVNEGAAVRAVAAAVVAAARDLVGGDRLIDALPEDWLCLAQFAAIESIIQREAEEAPPHQPTLRESLLDLPPPRC